MNATAKPPRRAKRPGTAPVPRGGASEQARRQAAAILEVLAGVRRPNEAAQVLEISLPRYYQLEQRALAGLVSACEPAPRGPRHDQSRQLARLEREKQRLQRECDRQQALVRVTQRSLGLLAPAKTSGKDSPAAAAGTAGKRRRNRRPVVRALRAARALAKDAAKDVAASGPAAEVAPVLAVASAPTASGD
jgi:hypothetical protein